MEIKKKNNKLIYSEIKILIFFSKSGFRIVFFRNFAKRSYKVIKMTWICLRKPTYKCKTRHIKKVCQTRFCVCLKTLYHWYSSIYPPPQQSDNQTVMLYLYNNLFFNSEMVYPKNRKPIDFQSNAEPHFQNREAGCLVFRQNKLRQIQPLQFVFPLQRWRCCGHLISREAGIRSYFACTWVNYDTK